MARTTNFNKIPTKNLKNTKEKVFEIFYKIRRDESGVGKGRVASGNIWERRERVKIVYQIHISSSQVCFGLLARDDFY